MLPCRTWCLNTVKSVRLSGCPHTRGRLGELPGPAVADSFADLGVDQPLVKGFFSAKRDARRVAALTRYARISALALPSKARACMVAASGTAVATYGVAAAPVMALGSASCARLQRAPPGGLFIAAPGKSFLVSFCLGELTPWRMRWPLLYLKAAVERGVISWFDVGLTLGLLCRRLPGRA